MPRELRSDVVGSDVVGSDVVGSDVVGSVGVSILSILVIILHVRCNGMLSDSTDIGWGGDRCSGNKSLLSIIAKSDIKSDTLGEVSVVGLLLLSLSISSDSAPISLVPCLSWSAVLLACGRNVGGWVPGTMVSPPERCLRRSVTSTVFSLKLSK